MLSIACVGSRAAPKNVLDWMEKIGTKIVEAGHRIVSGNAPGSDQAWARGGNKVDPKKVLLVLPWKDFEKKTIHRDNQVLVFCHESLGDLYENSILYASLVHGRWSACSEGARKLHGRNVVIAKKSGLMAGYPGSTGGTRLAFAVGKKLRIPVYDLREKERKQIFENAVEENRLEEIAVGGTREGI